WSRVRLAKRSRTRTCCTASRRTPASPPWRCIRERRGDVPTGVPRGRGRRRDEAERLARSRVAAGRCGHDRGRGVLVNSGQANAATGPRGEEDAVAAVAAAAAALGLAAADLLACSTGVIGEPLHLDRLLGAVPALASELE